MNKPRHVTPKDMADFSEAIANYTDSYFDGELVQVNTRYYPQKIQAALIWYSRDTDKYTTHYCIWHTNQPPPTSFCSGTYELTWKEAVSDLEERTKTI